MNWLGYHLRLLLQPRWNCRSNCVNRRWIGTQIWSTGPTSTMRNLQYSSIILSIWSILVAVNRQRNQCPRYSIDTRVDFRLLLSSTSKTLRPHHTASYTHFCTIKNSKQERSPCLFVLFAGWFGIKMLFVCEVIHLVLGLNDKVLIW